MVSLFNIYYSITPYYVECIVVSESGCEDWKKSAQYQPYRTAPLVSPTPRTINDAGAGFSQYQQFRGPQYRPTPRQQHGVSPNLPVWPIFTYIFPADSSFLSARKFLLNQPSLS